MKKLIYMPVVIFIAVTMISCNRNDSTSNSTQEQSSSSNGTPTSSQTLIPTPIKDFSFEEDDATVVITKYNGFDNTVVIPDTINNKPVAHIGANAFFKNNDIFCVVLPNTITSIGNRAFGYCESLSEITLPDSLEEIGACAFENSQQLTDVVLPKSLKGIAPKAFFNCKSLKQITIPMSCTLGLEAFRDSGLENILFENGVTTIPDTCFSGTNIKSLVFPQTVQTIERQAFGNCKNLKTVSLNEGLINIGDLAFYGTDLIEIVIPSTVTAIKESSFSNCSQLDKVKFEGNAPENFLRMLQNQHFKPENVHFTICYHKNALGFTSPEWNGYPTEVW